mmetsp:Transcript_13608/g.22480  ORF Transcript_13608/g.22480 Transcript_13608/m.22480 type:complete len:91 (+) Transcript_13608:129-401(+)
MMVKARTLLCAKSHKALATPDCLNEWRRYFACIRKARYFWGRRNPFGRDDRNGDDGGFGMTCSTSLGTVSFASLLAFIDSLQERPHARAL